MLRRVTQKWGGHWEKGKKKGRRKRSPSVREGNYGTVVRKGGWLCFLVPGGVWGKVGTAGIGRKEV